MSDTQSTTDTPIDTYRWQDCPRLHTTGPSIATKLRLIAEALDTLGELELAPTWASLYIQIDSKENPAARVAAVDAIAAALGLGTATGGDKEQYGTRELKSVSVYTAALNLPKCCEHCTAARS